MKNLIITMGILLLMTMGTLYDGDCAQVMCSQRKLRGVCEEMAEAGVIALETASHQENLDVQENGNYREEKPMERIVSLEAAENAAEEILRRNREEDAVWELEKEGNTVIVKVDAGPAQLRLPFLDRRIHLSYTAEKTVQIKK